VDAGQTINRTLGMFDQHILDLFQEDKISEETAFAYCSILFKKGLKDYASLFVPYSATLKLHGKS